MNTRIFFLISSLLCSLWMCAQYGQYVDPRIGSEGVGRTFPGPSMPYGMVKPGPDCGVKPNAGWAPMPEPVTGFSQTHVSGTGGGQKYGNILIQPFLTEPGAQSRESEQVSLGYYATTYVNGIRTEVTTSERCAFYRIHYPQPGRLMIDASHYLGKSDIPDLREAQQLVGAELEVTADTEVCGYSTVRGGWNNGDAYTVYFCLRTDRPFRAETDDARRVATLQFADTLVHVRIGISFVSTMQARRNIPSVDFDRQQQLLCEAWERQLGKVDLSPAATPKQKRMFYTALYHTMLMPVDRSGENPKWTDTPYYDDYYAIWDTYRTSSPLIILLDPERERDIVNSLLHIYRREGYMPDARSGNCNGRTQGGSNAEVVIADAYLKGVDGIDYEYALEAMLKDGEADPSADHEKHGRGGLSEYLALGYVPYGIDRAGNRTVEYAYDDYCIAQVAKGLGRADIYERYLKRSGYWKNLWRSDYEWDGMRGFVLPKDAEGRWLDEVPWGRSKVFHPTIPYTPVTKVAPWYLPWWSTFFYEATSEEYSLSIPHDVPGLIEACGGAETFRQRLDLFFEKKYYNVGNEPSFLTPCLYHWIGRPDLSVERVRQIVNTSYDDTPDGLPGNDDSGAMSSWLAFHIMGLYPNAGQSYYLLLAPMVPEYTLRLSNGRQLHVTLRGKGRSVRRVLFNGKPLEDARIEHSQLIQGGELVFERTRERKGAIATIDPIDPIDAKATIDAGVASPSGGISPVTGEPVFSGEIAYTLNRQFRTWPLTMRWEGDTLLVTCKEATYRIGRAVVEQAQGFCWDSPQVDGAVYRPSGTMGFISAKALSMLRETGSFVYDQITWRLLDEQDGLVHVRADVDRTEMWISTTAPLPFVMEMRHNPLGIDWKIKNPSLTLPKGEGI